MGRRFGARTEVLLIVLAAVAIPLAAEATALLRLDEGLEAASQRDAERRGEEAQDAVDHRLNRAMLEVSAAAAHPTAQAVVRAGGPTWALQGGAVVARAGGADPYRDAEARAAAAAEEAVVVQGPEGAWVVVDGAATLVRFVPAGELMAGLGDARLAAEPEGERVAVPLTSGQGYVTVPPGAGAPAAWRAAAAALLFFSVAGAALVAAAVTTRIVQPIRRLERVAQEFAAGNYRVRTWPSGAAEPRALAEAFNAMAAELERHDLDLRMRASALETDIRDLQFAAAHDFRETLRSIAILSRQVAEDPGADLPPEDRQALAAAAAAAHHLENVASDVERILEAGRRPLRAEPVDLGALARRTLAGTPASVAGGALAEADPGAVEEVLSELAENARKFAGPDPRLRVVLWNEGGRARVRVEDRGPGIPAALRQEVLRPFRRLHRGEHPGTGAGLAVVDRLVTRMHGALQIGESPGGGAAITVDLPEPRREPS